MSDVKAEPSGTDEPQAGAGSLPENNPTRLRERTLARLQGAREKAEHVQIVVVENGKKAARATDDYVHEHPWTCIGIAASVGLLVGLLLNRD